MREAKKKKKEATIKEPDNCESDNNQEISQG
jgi:hypothetical protein